MTQVGRDARTSLPLSELSERISSKTSQWIKEADEREAMIIKELEDDEALESLAFFQLGGKEDDGDESDDLAERVKEWISSSSNVDGIGGYSMTADEEDKLLENIEEDAIKVKYILSDKAGGHGDDLWAASRYIANVFSDPSKCHELLYGLGRINEVDCHPLFGVRLLELGAGGGLPSWLAMKCGAQVVCTDQSIPDRIRCLAECAQRNLNDLQRDLDEENPILGHAKKVRVCPYDWGSATDEVISDMKGEVDTDDCGLFDIVLAADCVYMPQCHIVLLDSIKKLLSKCGVALLPFALHGNTSDDDVWAILKLARKKGFFVEVLESVQLTPQAIGMDEKRGLVNMVRLKKI